MESVDTVVNARPDLLDRIARMLMTAQNQWIPVRMVEPVLMVTIPTLAAALETIEDQHVRSVNIITVRNVVAERLCFHRRLSFCSQGVCIPACTGANTPLADISQHALGQTPPNPRRPLQQMVRILLECFLVQYNFLKVVYESGVKG